MNFRFKNIVSTVIHLLDISWTRITFNKTSQNQDLLSNKDLLEILNTVKNTDISTKNNLDISHQQLGDKRSLYRGNGMDYEESRKYQLGDDPRYMNWQLSARTGQHYMKVFREERQPSVFIMIDRRVTMRFGTQTRLKVTQATRLAAAIAFTAQKNNMSVGGLIVDENLDWFKESQNKQRVYNFIKQAARPVLPVYKMKNNNTKSTNSIDFIMRNIKEVLSHSRGSSVYLLSDFYDLDEKSQPLLLQLSILHNIKAINISDIAEIKLPKVDILKVKSNLDDNISYIDGYSSSKIKYYNSILESHLIKKKEMFEQLAIPYQTILTSVDNIVDEMVF